jgi:hypothetical protein
MRFEWFDHDECGVGVIWFTSYAGWKNKHINIDILLFGKALRIILG